MEIDINVIIMLATREIFEMRWMLKVYDIFISRAFCAFNGDQKT